VDSAPETASEHTQTLDEELFLWLDHEPPEDYALAREVGACLGTAGYGVITGGGPGLMEAANRGEWDGLLDWLRTRALADRRIDAADMELLRVVGRPSKICEIVDAAHERQHAAGHPQRRRGPSQYERR
jgi:predicted Rossmann-fold nucleotide-binding protein